MKENSGLMFNSPRLIPSLHCQLCFARKLAVETGEAIIHQVLAFMCIINGMRYNYDSRAKLKGVMHKL